MSVSQSDLAALLGSRICHDLISPLGAIGNGIELLMMSSRDTAPEISLISESTANANAKVLLFRVAFGASSQDSSVSASDIRSMLSDYFHGSRVEIDCGIQDGVPRNQTKLLFLLILCLEKALAWGGRISISLTGNGWLLRGTATRMSVNPQQWELALGTGDAEALTPATVQFALVADVSRQIGRPVTFDLGETEIRISF